MLYTWRKAWEEHANRALAAAGSPERIDCRSLADRNIDRATQPKLGIAKHARNPIPHLVQRRERYALVNHRNLVHAQVKALKKLRSGKRLAASQHAARTLPLRPVHTVEIGTEFEKRRRRRMHAVGRGEGLDS